MSHLPPLIKECKGQGIHQQDFSGFAKRFKEAPGMANRYDTHQSQVQTRAVEAIFRTA